MPLTIEEKKLWVDALRSNDYKQTKGTLHNLDDGGFCCLGVAAKILNIGKPEMFGCYPYEDEDLGIVIDEGSQGIYDKFRFDLLSSQSVRTLTEMNDRGDTFAEIADWIEEKL